MTDRAVRLRPVALFAALAAASAGLGAGARKSSASDETPSRAVVERATTAMRAGELAKCSSLLEGTEETEDPSILALRVDIALALGRYEAAERDLQRLASRDRRPDTATRQARLAWLKGDPSRAEASLREALVRQENATRYAPEIAPYHARLGQLLLDTGRLTDAEREFKAAIKILNDQHAKAHELDADHDHTELFTPAGTAGLALIQGARGDAKAAERNWKLVALHAPEPSALVAMGDAYAADGRPREAQAAYDRAEALAKGRPQGRRELARFYADHDRSLDLALEWARAEAAGRDDVETQDLLAWALYKNAKVSEAGEAIERALRLGTLDARLWYHAGMIHAGLGLGDRARRELERALSLNPHFHPLEAPKAKQALDGGPGGGSLR